MPAQSDSPTDQGAAPEIAFVQLLQSMVPPDARMILCQFPGDPDEVDDSVKWRPKVWNVDLIQPNWNIYLCVSAMGRGGIDGKWRRTKDCYQGGLCFMIDDIGTKLPMSLLDMLPATTVVESSQPTAARPTHSLQAIYAFDRLVEDAAKHDALISNFIAAHCPDGIDTGMAGINRVFRPPFGINGKAAYKDENGKPCRVRMRSFDPTARYSLEQIAEAFGITLVPPKPKYKSNRKPGDRDDRIQYFNAVILQLRKLGMLKHSGDRTFNRAGWAQIHCPWRDGHTKNADTGASIRWPDPDNDFNGAFRCHHGHCEGRTWRDLTDILNDLNAEALEAQNAAGWDFGDGK